MDQNEFVNTYIAEIQTELSERLKTSLIDRTKIKILEKTIENKTQQVAELVSREAELSSIIEQKDAQISSMQDDLSKRKKKISESV